MKAEKEWLKAMAEALPEEPGRDLLAWARADGAFHDHYALFRRESVYREPAALRQIMTSEEIRAQMERPRTWGAVCKCSNCGGEFEAGYQGGKKTPSGILLTEGDDGSLYPGFVPEGEERAVLIPEDEAFLCPFCQEEVTLVRQSRLRNGRSIRIMAVTLEEINGAAVLLYWMMERWFSPDGQETEDVWPREAVAVDPEGRLRRFSHTVYGANAESTAAGWRPARYNDPESIPYYSWTQGGAGRKTQGAFYCREGLPTLAGTTGEKTGLVEYIIAGGRHGAKYLRNWQKHPAIENLVKAGPLWAGFVGWSIAEPFERMIGYGELLRDVEVTGPDWEKAKPNEMLYMTKEEFRYINGNWRGSRNKDLQLWLRYAGEGGEIRALDFFSWALQYGADGLTELLDSGNTSARELEQALRYLDKQEDERPRERLQTYLDYLRMLSRLQRPAEWTKEERYPRHLLAAHERMAATVDWESAQYDEDFKKLKALYAPLEWSDGELCIVVPAANRDLIREGRTLNHCVGGYGAKHTGGKPVFFVRHARRPERSYYTLNINMTTSPPKEIQLHGYGNEWHDKPGGGMARHGIPQKVRDFVDRWEREILLPWAEERRREALSGQAEADKTDKGKRSAA